MAPNPQENAISATHVLGATRNVPASLPNRPTYTGGYDSIIRPNSSMPMSNQGSTPSLLVPPHKTYLSQNLDAAEASSSRSASRDGPDKVKRSKKEKRGEKRKAQALADDDERDNYARRSVRTEEVRWVYKVDWFGKDGGRRDRVTQL
jgi:hypothetical protein